jgi:hypothetical protein
MLGRTLAAWLTAVGTGLALSPAVSADAPAVSARTSYALYCASCHGPNGEGAGGSLRPDENAPPLSHLGAKYGLPLPRARLASFVLLDTRPGGGRLCGDHLLPGAGDLRARGALERMVVKEALDHLEALQRQATK